MLGRARRRTLVVDDGNQSNLAASGIGGLLGHDGVRPRELYAHGRAESSPLTRVSRCATGTVIGGVRDDGGFVLELGDGTS